MDVTKEFIKKYTNLAKKNVDNFVVVMISNVKNLTRSFDYNQTSVSSEYYSLSQFQEIKNAIIDNGFEVKYYLDEEDFIHDFEFGFLRDNYTKKLLVLNSAQKGISAGRKSLIPAYCDLKGILYAGNDAFVTSFTRNKFIWTQYLCGENLHMCPSWLFTKEGSWMFGKKPENNENVIAKLAQESSSIGLTNRNVCYYSEDFVSFLIELTQNYNQAIIVQRKIDGYEVEVPFARTKSEVVVFSPVGITINDSFYLGDQILDYEIRGEHKFDFCKTPPNQDPIMEKIKENTKKIAEAMQMQGFGRIDYRIDDENNFYVTDINSSPHITQSMSIYKNFEWLGMSFLDVINTILGMAIDTVTHPN